MAEGSSAVGRRPLAEAFDLVLSEYGGYTDETILDLTFDRFKQMVDVINERKVREMKSQQKWDLQIAEIVVTGVGQLLPGLAKTKKQAKSIMDGVRSIKIANLLDKKDGEKEKEENLPSTASVMQAFGIRGNGLGGLRG